MSVEDMVRVQYMLLDHLGIQKVYVCCELNDRFCSKTSGRHADPVTVNQQILAAIKFGVSQNTVI